MIFACRSLSAVKANEPQRARTSSRSGIEFGRMSAIFAVTLSPAPAGAERGQEEQHDERTRSVDDVPLLPDLAGGGIGGPLEEQHQRPRDRKRPHEHDDPETPPAHRSRSP